MNSSPLTTTSAITVAAFTLSDHQLTEGRHCMCGSKLRSEINLIDALAEHQASILSDVGLLAD